MFPITYNAIGDIIAVAQLIRDIAEALSEVKGASHEYRAFVQQLQSTATIIDETHRLVHNSPDDHSLRIAILDEVRCCCSDLQRAEEYTTGFETLLSGQTSGASGPRRVRKRLARSTKMLQWHFMKSSEISDLSQRFHNRCLRIQTLLILFNGARAHGDAKQQLAYPDSSLAALRNDIASSSRIQLHQLDNVAHGLRSAVNDVSAQWIAQTIQQNDTVLRAINASTLAASSVIVESLRAMQSDMDRNRITEKTSAASLHPSQPIDSDVEAIIRCMMIAFPVLISWLVMVVAETEFAAPGTRWHSRTLWSAIFTLVLYSLCLSLLTRRPSVPVALRYGRENGIIFVDFIGSHLTLPLELCGTIDDFRDFVQFLFSKDKRKGWSFVLAQAYEIMEATSSTTLTSSSWSGLVRVGAEVQLGALVRRRGLETDNVICPYCDTEALQDPTPQSGNWISCVACSKLFQASTARETIAVENVSSSEPEISDHVNLSNMLSKLNTAHTNTPSDVEHAHGPNRSGNVLRKGPIDSPQESILDFKLVHVLRVVVEYDAAQFAFPTPNSVSNTSDTSVDGLTTDSDDDSEDSDLSADFWNTSNQILPPPSFSSKQSVSNFSAGSPDDDWADRPSPEYVVNTLEQWFPHHDVDKPITESQSVNGVSRKWGRKRSRKLWDSQVEEVPSSPVRASQIRKPIFKWLRGEVIGKGKSGRVYLAMNVTTGEMFAAKQVRIPRSRVERSDAQLADAVESLELESEMLKDLDHPNIVQYLGFEETPTSLTIFLEYVPGGSISGIARKFGRFDENATKSFTSQILLGLEYIHSRGIVHRDIKGADILVDGTGHCKIADFGLSTRLEEANGYVSTIAMAGSVFWTAPEVVNPSQGGYNEKIDIWSLGCVVLEMWTGERPWRGFEAAAVIVKLYSTKQAPPVLQDTMLSDMAYDFRRLCFQGEPNERPGATELKSHPYLRLPTNWTFRGFT